MNISSSTSASMARAAAPSREAAELPGMPDNDGDSDDVAAAASAQPQGSAKAAGVGQAVDVFA
jgi:hypothetical protein